MVDVSARDQQSRLASGERCHLREQGGCHGVQSGRCEFEVRDEAISGFLAYGAEGDVRGVEEDDFWRAVEGLCDRFEVLGETGRVADIACVG